MSKLVMEDGVRQLQQTCSLLGVHENNFKVLSKPIRTVLVSLPIKMDDGVIRIFEGCRTMHTNIMGPGKGGIRFSPTSSVEEAQAFAMLMTWKCALIGLPLSGARGYVKVDPSKLSLSELESLTRRYTASIINIIGPDMDIPAPDLNTNAQTMAWLMDTYSMGVGKTTPGVCTGKHPELGGIIGRNRAVGWGLGYISRAFAQKEHEKLQDQRVVIQGIGQVGKNAARIANEHGARIVAISDSCTGLYKEDGLDINNIITYKNEHGSLLGYEQKDVQSITNAELLTLPCDVLVPCATQHQITVQNVEKLECDTIIEGANMPITFAADEILNEKKIPVIPDILANSGGAITSYFEWVQGIGKLRWTGEKVAQKLEEIILKAFDRVYELKKEKSVSFRQAAHMLAVRRVEPALKYRGIYP